mgnify:CR=1 FL=1
MMNRLKKYLALGLLAFSFGYGLRLTVPAVYAVVIESAVYANKMVWTRGGVSRFVQYVTSGNQMTFQNQAQPTPSDVYISTYNALGIPRVTTAQVGALDPVNEGELIYNSDRNTLCISTGTGIGSYGIIAGFAYSSATTASATSSTGTACGTGG